MSELPAATAPGPKKKALWRRGTGLLPSALALPVLLGTAGCVLWWGLATQSGSAWLLSHVPGLQIEALEGSLIGDLSVKKLRYTLAGSGDRLEIDDLRWQGLSLAWNASPGLWADLRIQNLQAKRVHVQLTPSGEVSKAPTDLRLPLGLRIDALGVDELAVPSLSDKPLAELRASLAVSADGGAQHQIKIENLRWDLLQLSAAASIKTTGDMHLQADLDLRSKANGAQDLPAWSAQAKLQGPLQKLELRADLQALAQQLQLQAQMQPFAAWPLPRAKLNTRNLDLSALASGLPHTGLSGHAELLLLEPAKPAAMATLNIKSELRNSLAGLWDTQRLPVRALDLDLNFEPGDPATLGIKRLELLLGSAQQPAGRVHARGASSKQSGSQLVIAVDGLSSAGLDSRVAALQLAGQIELSTGRAVNQLQADGPPPLLLKIDAKLDGRLASGGALPAAAAGAGAAPGLALSLQAQAQASRSELNLQSFRLQSDGSELQASGQVKLQQAGSLTQGWQARAKASAQLADLRRFWRGNEGSSWQQSPQSIQALFEADLRAGPLPNRQANKTGNLKQLAPFGSARLQVLPTNIGGVPLSADLHYQYADGGKPPSLDAALQAGASNQMQLQAGLTEAGQMLGAFDLRFEQLAGLQPLLAAFGEPLAKPKKPIRLEGSLTGKLKLQASPANNPASAEGWTWHSHAELQARTLQLSGMAGQAALSLASANLDWELDSAKDAPLDIKARLEQLGGSGWKVPSASASVQGSWAKHRLSLQALAEGKMPPALIPPGQAPEQSLRGPFSLSLLAGLSTAPNLAWRDGAQWQASEIRLQAQAQDLPAPKPQASAPLKGGANKPPWLNAQDLRLAMEFAPQGALKKLQLEPGRLEILGAGLRWQSMKWAPGALAVDAKAPGAASVDIDLNLEPVSVAPLLARWQPDFGWSGDLQLVGYARIKSSPKFNVDIALQRSGGDLVVTDDSGVQKLDLSELRLGLIGSPGVWHLTEALAGSNIGVLGAALTARNDDPAATWPRADSRLEGVLEARVANLGTWGAWVPAGWRMGGSLFASAGFGGRLRAPEIKGRAGGSGLVLRNPLLGVDLQRGEFALSLDGGRARLEQFKAHAGDGELTAQGDVLFGDSPRADLQIRADKFALLRRVDQRLAVNGKLELKLDADALDIAGQLSVHEGFFDFSRGNAPSLDSDVEVRRPETAEKAAVADAAHTHGGTGRRNAKVKVKIDIDLGKKLRVSGFGLDTLLAGNLQLTQAANGPALHGRIHAESGTFAAYGQKLAIERGLITFAGVVDNPRLDVLAIRPTQEEQRIGVTITGTARNPRVKLFSEPALDERSMLSWLLLGREPDELNSRDNALLSSAAMALLSGTGESTTSKLIKSVGLDDLSFSDSGDQAQGTVVRLGKQISNRWSVGYERGLNATRGSWQAIYRLAQRFTLRAQSGDENSLDLIWQWRWE
ncbi:translocation/assembly module TamB domain-containing protein [Roseateles oligotrophus]|uniref:Translocation/assembly module TamB domain-containing protein n=1 Tax=Roseateles oligotrophus TaxID=1769250 RepID=A0ABT2Y9Q4_9BURK|nr:translocation/assembly module TamB domain-containing protein [Roseateles oligotrophus]MCV2367032.1 translocation/assembly module TamB domain-containing protein [Roseateles oligotrophus]